jgi:hypothetical protein
MGNSPYAIPMPAFIKPSYIRERKQGMTRRINIAYAAFVLSIVTEIYLQKTANVKKEK